MPRFFNSPIRVNRVNFYSSSVWVVPPGVNLVYVTLVGGGGGGGGHGTGSINPTAPTNGGGGGAGFSFINAPIYVSPTESISIIIGSGGVAGTMTRTGDSGRNGGASLFGSYLSASGGQGGIAGGDTDVPLFPQGKGGDGGSYGPVNGGAGPQPGIASSPHGTTAQASVTQSLAGASTILFIMAGGGGGGAGQMPASAAFATFAGGHGSAPGSPYNSPFTASFQNSVTRSAGGASSALGQGDDVNRRSVGFGAGGRGSYWSSPLTPRASGSDGLPGFCSISWD